MNQLAQRLQAAETLASRLDAHERLIEQLAQRINTLEAWITALTPRHSPGIGINQPISPYVSRPSTSATN